MPKQYIEKRIYKKANGRQNCPFRGPGASKKQAGFYQPALLLCFAFLLYLLMCNQYAQQYCCGAYRYSGSKCWAVGLPFISPLVDGTVALVVVQGRGISIIFVSLIILTVPAIQLLPAVVVIIATVPIIVSILMPLRLVAAKVFVAPFVILLVLVTALVSVALLSKYNIERNDCY
jgi:hypothetical protein